MIEVLVNVHISIKFSENVDKTSPATYYVEILLDANSLTTTDNFGTPSDPYPCI